ncbi:MAG: cell cycle transcriptional regulator TrcR [Pseudomonadota bacterium]
MAFPLMPKATAAWLVDSTSLTFDQIAEFCGLHPLEVQALADGDVNSGIMGASPILNGELAAEEIARCEKNTNARLKMCKTDLPKPRARSRGPRYTPVTKRIEKPGAVLFLIKKHPELADVQIARLVGSTKPTVGAIRSKTHPASSSLKPVDPVSIGLCTGDELDKAIKKALRRTERLSKTAEAAASPLPEPEQNKDEMPPQTASA